MAKKQINSNHSKVKARDLIPGWPRGRTTTVSYANTRWRYDALCFYWYNLTDSMMEQLTCDKDYHQYQQGMVDRYLAAYRLKPSSEEKEWIRIFNAVGGVALDAKEAKELIDQAVRFAALRSLRFYRLR